MHAMNFQNCTISIGQGEHIGISLGAGIICSLFFGCIGFAVKKLKEKLFHSDDRAPVGEVEEGHELTKTSNDTWNV